MPAKWFMCPDSETIEIAKCLEVGGCRMPERCATRPFLRLIGFDRKWQGVSPSSAGSGPRSLFLKAVTNYTIDPQNRVWAAFGTGTHGKLSLQDYVNDVLSEESFGNSGEGTPDCLDYDEEKAGYYILDDYKTWGSYKVAKALGIVSEKKEETIVDSEGKPVLLKSGKDVGKPKTKQHTIITVDPGKVDLKGEELQLNHYRISFEQRGFPISKMRIQAIPRDGGTYIAKNRGIDKNLYIIPIKRLHNNDVLSFYQTLSDEVNEGFQTGYVRKCNIWENWERRRCEGVWCEVSEACKEMSKKAGEKWGLI